MQTIEKIQNRDSCGSWPVSFRVNEMRGTHESSAPPGCSGASTSCEAFTRHLYWRGGNGKARCTGLVTDMHRTGKIISPFVTQAVPPNCHSLHCYAKEKEKFTSEDKMVLLFKQSQCLCNSSLNGEVQLEPGTCCLQKYHVMSNNVKCSKWR